MMRENASFLPCLRLCIYIPTKDAQNFIQAVQDHIPAFLGHYDRVLWSACLGSEAGMEQFRPLEGARPATGKIGETVTAPSTKIEFCIPDDRALCERLIRSVILPAHPWEEPVIFITEGEIFRKV